MVTAALATGVIVVGFTVVVIAVVVEVVHHRGRHRHEVRAAPLTNTMDGHGKAAQTTKRTSTRRRRGFSSRPSMPPPGGWRR
jgi:hypothetical protein